MGFPANPGTNKLLQLKLCGVALINGKYIKHFGHFILNNHEATTVEACLYPEINWGKPTFAEFRITNIERGVVVNVKSYQHVVFVMR